MTVLPSGEQFEIVHGPHRATVVEVGGGIRSCVLDGHMALDGYAPDEPCTGARGLPLVPWPNRLADGRYTFDGTDYQVALTEPDRHNAIHGFLRWRNWEARDRAADRVVLGTRLHPLEGYPFTLDVEVGYALTPTGLTVTTQATNVGDRPCPYGSGQHPYLTAGTRLIDPCTLHLDAGRWIPTDDRGLPTGTAEVAGSAFDFRAARAIGDQHVDYAFTDLARDADGLAWAHLTGPDGQRRSLWADASYPYLEIYTGDTQPPDKRRRGLGVEPMTCAPNAFASGEGLIRLEPGATVTSRWGLRAD